MLCVCVVYVCMCVCIKIVGVERASSSAVGSKNDNESTRSGTNKIQSKMVFADDGIADLWMWVLDVKLTYRQACVPAQTFDGGVGGYKRGGPKGQIGQRKETIGQVKRISNE